MENNKEKNWYKRIQGTRGYAILGAFIKSAAVGLLFAIVCFVFDRVNDAEQNEQLQAQNEKLQASVSKLDTIQKSLSTRSLGIFPGYIKEIRELFNNIDKSDTIVIMEDVLYYGFKSKPKEFYEMNKRLFDHAMQGGVVTIAYYNYEYKKVPIVMDIFHNMIKNEYISSDNIAKMNKECDSFIKTIRQIENNDKLSEIWNKENELCEKYFKATINKDFKKFENSINIYLSTELVEFGENETSQGAGVAKDMCRDIQTIKEKYLKKDLNKITFADFEKMNREISDTIAKYYKKRGITMVPLNEYLTMSCWMVNYGNSTSTKAVLAFPSKYSSDEIGFYSQDEAFAKYISTMLNGILANQNLENGIIKEY